MGTMMFPTFRILLATIGLAILAVAVAAHGLIATPEVHTRIGEVPTVSRSLIQQAMVPRLPVQALTIPIEEHAVFPEVTGMASGQEIVRLPLERVDSRDSARIATGLTQAAEEAEPADPLGELIKTVISQTPEPPPTVIAEKMPAQPAETAAAQRTVPVPDMPAGPAEAASQPLVASPDAASLPSKTRNEDTAQADGKDAAPAKSGDMREAGEKRAAPPGHGENFGLPSSSTPPTLALGGEPTGRGHANTESQSKTPTAVTAALHSKDTQHIRSPKKAGNRRGGSARKTIDRQRPAIEKRTVRRKPTTKSRATSTRKSRHAVRPVNRHKSRRAAYTTPRRGVVTVAPRRRTPARSAPAVQYLSPVYPHQVDPSGYYLPAARAGVAR